MRGLLRIRLRQALHVAVEEGARGQYSRHWHWHWHGLHGLPLLMCFCLILMPMSPPGAVARERDLFLTDLQIHTRTQAYPPSIPPVRSPSPPSSLSLSGADDADTDANEDASTLCLAVPRYSMPSSNQGRSSNGTATNNPRLWETGMLSVWDGRTV